jgi:4a-hydroxytetrahydrobiopterin dehydratase
MSKKLSQEEIASEIKNFKFWSINENKLYRKIKFKDFVSAFSFMTHIAIHAEKLNHHPEWKNVYNQLEIWLTTHDANGISKKDFELAKIIDEYIK